MRNRLETKARKGANGNNYQPAAWMEYKLYYMMQREKNYKPWLEYPKILQISLLFVCSCAFWLAKICRKRIQHSHTNNKHVEQ